MNKLHLVRVMNQRGFIPTAEGINGDRMRFTRSDKSLPQVSVIVFYNVDSYYFEFMGLNRIILSTRLISKICDTQVFNRYLRCLEEMVRKIYCDEKSSIIE